MIRSKGEAGTGNIVEAVRHMREITGGIRRLPRSAPRSFRARRRSYALRSRSSATSPSASGPRADVPRRGIATPGGRRADDAAGRRGELRRLGGSSRARIRRDGRAIVEATTHFEDAERVAAASAELGEPMRGDDIAQLAEEGSLLQQRGW